MNRVKTQADDSRYKIDPWKHGRHFAMHDQVTGDLLAVFEYKVAAERIRTELEARDRLLGNAPAPQPAPHTLTAADLHRAIFYLHAYASRIQTAAPDLAAQIRAIAEAISPKDH